MKPSRFKFLFIIAGFYALGLLYGLTDSIYVLIAVLVIAFIVGTFSDKIIRNIAGDVRKNE
jgi:hypothetical protein